MIDALIILCLAFIQHVTHTLSIRARNRNNHRYIAVCSFMSNAFLFLVLRQIILSDLSLWLIIPYLTGVVAGSLIGATLAIRIERVIGAKT